MKFVERPAHEVAAKKGCDGQNHMTFYHDNRLSLRQTGTAAFKTKFRGTVHLFRCSKISPGYRACSVRSAKFRIAISDVSF